jgi:hypothetical protein
MLQRNELRVEAALTLPEDRHPEGRVHESVRVEACDVHPPRGVTAMVEEGKNRVPVTLHRLVERRLPVRFDPGGEERICHCVVEPPTVLVRGPEELLDRARFVSTQPCELPPGPNGAAAAETVTVEPVPLVSQIEGRQVCVNPCNVTVHLTLQPQQRLYNLEVPVQFLCPPGFPLKPGLAGEAADGKVTVSVRGPAQDETPAVLAFIDLTRHKYEPGLYQEQPRLQLPKDFQVVQPAPRPVPFRLDPPPEHNVKALGEDQ